MLDEFDKADLKYQVGFGNQYEGFWLNADQWPMNSKAVRQSLLYATDRQAIVDQILKPSVREGRVLQSFIVPTFPQYYSPTFSQYSKNQSMVDELMTGDGWARAPTASGPRTARRRRLQVATTSGNENA